MEGSTRDAAAQVGSQRLRNVKSMMPAFGGLLRDAIAGMKRTEMDRDVKRCLGNARNHLKDILLEFHPKVLF